MTDLPGEAADVALVSGDIELRSALKDAARYVAAELVCGTRAGFRGANDYTGALETFAREVGSWR